MFALALAGAVGTVVQADDAPRTNGPTSLIDAPAAATAAVEPAPSSESESESGREAAALREAPPSSAVASAPTGIIPDPVLGFDLPERELSVLPAPPGARGTGESAALGKYDPRRFELTRVLGALGVVLTLLGALRFIVRRGKGLGAAGRPAGVLEILARYPVGRGRSLVLLKLGRRLVLVHDAGGTMQPITEVTDTDEVARLLGSIETSAPARRAGPSFADVLRATPGAGPASPTHLEPTEIVDLTRRSVRVRRGGAA